MNRATVLEIRPASQIPYRPHLTVARFACQIALAIILGAAVVAAVWARSQAGSGGRLFRAWLSVDREDADSVLYLPRAVISRAEYESCDEAENAPPTELVERSPTIPEELRRSLPAGSVYEVSIKSGFAARLPDKKYGVQRHWNVAYACEIRFERTIESNDGNLIIERRRYRDVCETKLLTPAGPLRVDPGPPGRPLLDRLPRPSPEEGTAVIPARLFATTVLAEGTEAVASHPRSRAFVSHGPLHNREVRLHIRNGLGVEKVEAIGWQLSLEETGTYILFSTPLIADEYLRPFASMAETGSVLARDAFGWLPSNLIRFSKHRASVLASGESAEGGQDAILQLSCDLWGMGRRTPESPAEGDLVGTVRYCTADRYVKSARVKWQMDDRLNFMSMEDLLFENEYRSPPVAEAVYECRRRPAL